MKTQIILYGRMRKLFGEKFEFSNVPNLKVAISALNSVNNDFKKTLMDDFSNGMNYQVFINRELVKNVKAVKRLEKNSTIEIVPCISGQDPITILVAVVGNLIITGITMLLTPAPESVNEQRIEASIKGESYIFETPDNVARQGQAYPLGYGRLRIGSQIINSTVTSVDLANFSTSQPDLGYDNITEQLSEFLNLDVLNRGYFNGGNTDPVDFDELIPYKLTSANIINEGEEIIITLTTTQIADGTIIPYTISGTNITPSDFNLTSLTGNFVINNKRAYVILSIAAGATAGADETFTVALDNGEASTGPITIPTPTYTFSAPNAINEGQQLAIILNTTGISNNTIIPYTITGSISSDDIGGADLYGNFIVIENKAFAIFNITADYSLRNSENIEIFTLTLDSIGEAVSVNINDSSIQTFVFTPTPEIVDEGQTVFVKLRTQGVSNGAVLPYTISGTSVTADALNLDSLTGDLVVQNDYAVLVITLVRDAFTRGIEAFTFALDNGEGSTEVGVAYVPPYWLQVGQDFYYHPIFAGTLQAAPYQVSMNSVGDIVAVSYDTDRSLKDTLRVYSDNDGSWTQLGGDILSPDYFSFSIHKLNSAGNMIAVVARGQTGFSIDQGDSGSYVSIWQLNNETWEQVGQSIYDPDEPNGNFPNVGWGAGMDISDDCSIVAISSSLGSTTEVNARVFQNINGTWTQLGQDLHPSADYAAEAQNNSLISAYGKNIALNSAGNVLAMGDSLYRTFTGQFRIWEYINSTWTQVALFEGPLYEDEQLGEAIALNSAGDMFAARGTRYINGGGYGFIRIYENINGTWEQTSQINGPYTANVGRIFGGVLSFNAAGNILFVGSKKEDLNAQRGFVFKLDPTIDGLFKWEEVGQEVADAYSGMINSAGDRFIAVDNNTPICSVYELDS